MLNNAHITMIRCITLIMNTSYLQTLSVKRKRKRKKHTHIVKNKEGIIRMNKVTSFKDKKCLKFVSFTMKKKKNMIWYSTNE